MPRSAFVFAWAPSGPRNGASRAKVPSGASSEYIRWVPTVRVPPEMRALFDRAENAVAAFFRDRVADPERGTIEIRGERYILVRAASLSLEFFDLVRSQYGEERRDEADAFSRSILFDLAHAVGKSDALKLQAKMNLDDPMSRLSAGPVHFAHAGWASVDLLPESRPSPDRDFCLVYENPSSFESDAWSSEGRRATFPVCIMNAGYSSGWSEESFGMPLVASEILCRGKGDEACRFVMAPPDQIEKRIAEYVAGNPALAPRIAGHRIPHFFERKREEEALREELRQTQKLEALGRLAGGVANDFNNLLGIMTGETALMRGRLPPDDPLQSGLARIAEAGDRAAALTQQLLAFGRAQVARAVTLDLNALIAEFARQLSPMLGDRVALQLRLAPDAGTVHADPAQLQQALMNLVVNARDAMPEGGQVEITTARESGESVIMVRDDGSGMDSGTLARAFEPFFTTRGEKRNGLGLSTVYGIVHQAGGTLTATSAPGEGATFRVMLPRTGEAVSRSLTPVVLEVRHTRPMVLLVEDREELRAIIADVLTAIGYRPRPAKSAEHALEILADASAGIDILLTDVLMPRIGGAELAARARAVRPGLRVLFMSGFAPDPEDRRVFGADGGAFLQKPFSPEELGAKLEALFAAPV